MNEWILKLIGLIFSVASPEVRKMVETMVTNLEQQARATKNPWDDVLVALLKQLLLGNRPPVT